MEGDGVVKCSQAKVGGFSKPIVLQVGRGRG